MPYRVKLRDEYIAQRGTAMTIGLGLMKLARTTVVVSAAVIAFLGTDRPAAAQGQKISIYFVGCAAPTGFHGYLARGAEEAGRNLGVKVTYIYPNQLTIPDQIEKIEEAIAAQANGIAVCAFAPDSAYAEVAARAKAAGIAFGSAAAPPPGVVLRNPDDMFLFRVGSDEREAGELTAKRLIAMGIKGRVVVGDQQPGDATCRARADGEIETLKAARIATNFIELTMDPGQQAETLFNFLRVHPHTAAASSICDVPDGFLKAKEESGRKDLIVTGYDLDSVTLAAIQDGRQAFTIDQQPFWRGYIPVLLLTHYIKYGLIADDYFLTGPAVVDKSNIENVAKLVKEGYR